MITFHIYYSDEYGNKITKPKVIEADTRQDARELFEFKYPDYTIKKVVDILDLDDNEYAAFMFI